MNESEYYNEKDNYGRFVITRVNNGCVVYQEGGPECPDCEAAE